MEDLQPLVQAFGSALYCQFLIREKVVLDVNQYINDEAINRFRNAVSGFPYVSFYFKIDKSILVLDRFGKLFENCKFPNKLYLYLYSEKLKYFLENCSLEQLEQKAFKNHWGDRIAFVVPSQDLFLIGPHIVILGGKYLLNPPPSFCQDNRIRIAEHERVIQQCQDTLKWQKPWITKITPWHLFIEHDSVAGHPITNALRVHFTNSFLLYTSDRTFEQGKVNTDVRMISRYSTSQQTLDIGFEKTEKVDIDALPNENYDALFNIFEWAYDANWKASDRLPIVQINVVEALKGVSLPLRYKLLIENAPTILENTTWHWKAFAEDKIESYWGQVHELENYVSDTLNSFSDQISAIVSKLTETVLAAVAVLLGSFIAALFQEKFKSNRIPNWFIYICIVCSFLPPTLQYEASMGNLSNRCK